MVRDNDLFVEYHIDEFPFHSIWLEQYNVSIVNLLHKVTYEICFYVSAFDSFYLLEYGVSMRSQ